MVNAGIQPLQNLAAARARARRPAPTRTSGRATSTRAGCGAGGRRRRHGGDVPGRRRADARRRLPGPAALQRPPVRRRPRAATRRCCGSKRVRGVAGVPGRARRRAIGRTGKLTGRADLGNSRRRARAATRFACSALARDCCSLGHERRARARSPWSLSLAARRLRRRRPIRRPRRPGAELRSDKIRVTTPRSARRRGRAGRRQPRVRGRACTCSCARAEPGNFIFSQTSISTALAMLYAGAGTTTAAEMATALHFTLPAERLHAGVQRARPGADHAARGRRRRRVPAQLANSLWVQDGFAVLPELPRHAGRELRRRAFRRGLRDQAPEPRASTINGWVSDRTEASDPGAVPGGSIDSMTRLVLANAVFFHGDWKTPFEHNSRNAPFHAPGRRRLACR